MVSKPGESNIVGYNEIYDIPGRSAVGTNGGVADLIVRYNHIHDVYNAFEPGHFRCAWSSTNNDGCQITDDEYRPAGNWCIYGNIVANTEVGLRLSASEAGGDNNWLYNNVFYNLQSAVNIGWNGVFETVIANNIFMNNKVGIYLQNGGMTTTVEDYLDQFVAHHNLYFNNSHADIHLRPNWGGNFYSGTSYDLIPFQTQFSQTELQAISADPQFINNTEFRLAEGSPATNTGSGEFWNIASVDMGAYPFSDFSNAIFVDGFEAP